MSDERTWPDEPEPKVSAWLPSRESPGGSRIESWCAALVERVCPGGFAPASATADDASLGSYRLLERLGRGGVGEIWRAEHVGIRKQVALKLLRPELASDPSVRRRFLREGRLAAAVEHSGVVDITDVGETEDGRAYLVMELLAGRTIAEEVRWSGPLPWPRARAIVVQLLDALAQAHRSGVIHRDLKPSNVMLGDEAGDDRCTVIDFGMACDRLGVDQSTELTRTGAVIGSPAYMSPEQFRGEEADARSDVYALGCLTYFMLAGRRPFDGQTPARLMYQHLMSALPRVEPLGVSSRGAAAIRRWLERACHKRPERRFPDVGAMLDALPGLEARSPWWRRRASWVGAGVLTAGAATATLALVPPRVPEGPPPGRADASSHAPPSALPRGGAEGPRCGDGHLDPGEGCDDGNTLAADGCEPDCEPTRIVQVRAGPSFTCATSRSHVRCWGQQGPHLGQPDHAGHIGDDELPHEVPPIDLGPQPVRALSFEFLARHVCVVLDDRSARCWGEDDSGQLGLGPDITHWGDAPGEHPARLPPLPLPPVHQIVAHEANTCALAGDHPDRLGVYCWGRNRHGLLGRGDIEPLDAPPTEPIDLGGVVVDQVEVGVANTCAVLRHGAVRCWGGNRNLQLGTGWPSDRYAGDGVGDGHHGLLPDTPELDLEGLEGFEVAAVRMNGGWACVLSTAGEVRCWGGNDDGALGHRFDGIEDCDEESHGVGCLVPRPTSAVELGDLGGARIVDLRMGRKRACVLDDAGAVRCWGWGNRGSLGYGSALPRATGRTSIGHHETPAQAYAAMGNGGIVDVGDLDHDGRIDPVSAIALGYSHTCVLAADHSVRCWGSNSEGQLGYGTTEDVGDDETPGEYYAAHECGAVPVFTGQGCRGDEPRG